MLLCAILISIIVDSGILAWYLHLQVGYLWSAQLVSGLTTGTVNQLEEITFSALAIQRLLNSFKSQFWVLRKLA